ncbi:hypothetical protein SteCoe_14689 [Stentor coeruleus]|uniref:Rab-GAP TBC domain-containing protein n=1 Tax=Stentor coeruleus TaxID=5963 RepID=A0A1R2C5I2_9CILI|nr:hypothetical protein SteCoe_14689 [Stentor coeruleus]
MASLSTNENTPMNSPSPRNILRSQHVVQCDCDIQRLPFIKRYLTFATKSQITSCWKVQEWLKYLNFPRDAENVYHNLLRSSLDLQEFSNSVRQIELDLKRTYPDEVYFNTKEGEDSLRRVLVAYCKYDPNLGYVQGMNYIVGALLWHCTEVDAFWIFVGLMEKHELRDTYLPSFPGLSKHCQIIQLLTLEQLPNLHRHFAQFDVQCRMYATEWCFSLFGSVVPANEMVTVLDNFFQKGWIFFYKFVIYILKRLEKQLLEANDLADIIMPLKICHKSQREWKDFLLLLDNGRRSLTWEIMMNEVSEIVIDEDYIRYLHLHFDLDKAQFVSKRSN